MVCNTCQGTGFKNLHQILGKEMDKIEKAFDFLEAIQGWIQTHDKHDVCICNCCGDGDIWYGIPGEHYHSDIIGTIGPYAYNGGLCECH